MPNVASYLFFILFIVFSQYLLPGFVRKFFLPPPRERSAVTARGSLYSVTVLIVLLQAGIAILVGLLNQLQIFGAKEFELKTVLWAIGFLGLMVLFADPLEWKYTSIQVKKRLIAFFPNNAQERVIWIAVSFSIALSEEIVYRAVLFGLFYRLLGTYWTAGIDSAAFFAFAHRSYGRISVGSTFVVGLVLQWFVRISGGLYISIAVHFIHNYLALIYAIRGEPVQNPDAALAEIEIKSHVNHHASK